MKKEDVQKRIEEVIKDVERKPNNLSYKLSREERRKALARLPEKVRKEIDK